MAEAGTLVGRFEIIRELGRGGMAVVYLARQTELARDVALKELASFQSADSSGAERFVRESRVSGSLAHRNIVTVFDFFRHEGTPYIAMEYLARGSLRPLVGQLSVAQAAGVIEGVLAGLSHAERRGIVHRDLKPENLLVTDDGEIKIADFGIAKALNQIWTVGPSLTAAGMALGTPTYMAPEQAMAKEIGPWTDLYSTGVIAYELLVGQVPFSGTDTPMAILFKHVNDPIPPPLEVNPDLDPDLAKWLESMLAKEPSGRPQSAQEAADALDEIVTSLLGARWRREARLVEEPEGAAPVPPPEVETPGTATPTTDGFETYMPRASEELPAPVPPEPAPPPVPEPVPPVPKPPVPTPVEEAPPPEPPPPAEETLATAPSPEQPPAAVETFQFPTASRGDGRRLPWLVAAGLLVAALAVGLVFVLKGGGKQHHTSSATGKVPSAPGVTFTRAHASPGVFAGLGNQEMQAVTPIGPDLLGVGYASGQVAAWRLSGNRWRKEPTGVLPIGQSAMNAVVSGPGATVAVGQVGPSGSEMPRAWVLANGSWHLTCLADCGARAVPYSVTLGQHGLFVAVGRELVLGHYDAAVWASSHPAVRWQRVEALSNTGLGGPSDQVMKSVVATRSGLLAVGRNGLDAAVWTSADGSRWNRVQSNAFGGRRAQEMDAVALGPSGLVAVGTDRSSGQTQGAAWASRDGTRWTRIRDGVLSDRPGTAITGITAVPGGFVAAGFRGAASEEKDALAWSTTDGRHWRKLSSASFGGPGAQEVDTVTYSPRFGVVAVGDTTSSSGDLDAAVWLGKLEGPGKTEAVP